MRQARVRDIAQEVSDAAPTCGRYMCADEIHGLAEPCPPHVAALATGSVPQAIDRKSTSNKTLKFGSTTLRELTKGQSCQTSSSGESECCVAVTTTAEALHLQRLDLLKHIETGLLRLQAMHEERKLTVIKEPTQTNTADGLTEALQTAKYLEWRNRLSMGYDTGDDGGTSKREALAETGR